MTRSALRGRQSGIALILVLWVTILLTVIAGSFAFAMRTDMQVVRNSVSLARVQAAADGAMYRALYESYKPFNDLDRWKADGVEHEVAFEGASVMVSALDESGKIDINTAAPELLKGLFVSVGIEDEAATALVDAVQDWRDSDDLARPHGAEEKEYQAAGLKYKPANLPFQTIDELRLVLGMSPDIYRRIENVITVYSRQPGLNLNIAPRASLLAIPGVTAEQVDTFIAQREAARAANQPIPLFPAAQRFAGAAFNLAFSLRADARLEDGTVFVREAVVQVLPDPKRPFAFLAWKESSPVAVQPSEGSTTEDGKPR